MAIQRYSDGFGDQFPTLGGSFSTMLDRFFNESVNRSGGLNRYTLHVDAYETEHQRSERMGQQATDVPVEDGSAVAPTPSANGNATASAENK